MPYRRLPKTDRARIRALKKVLDFAELPPNERPVSALLIQQASAYYGRFQTLVSQYDDSYNVRITGSKLYHKHYRLAKMYVSHFIQVLNLAYQRGEIKKEQMEWYNLDLKRLNVPKLLTEAQLVECGKNIIEGERKRIMNGGAAINFPSIAMVKIYYDQFLKGYQNKQFSQKNTNITNRQVKMMHAEVDELILRLWDSIEAFYSKLLPYERLMACKNAGVIYYYRTGERHLTPEGDEALRKARSSMQEFNFGEEFK